MPRLNKIFCLMFLLLLWTMVYGLWTLSFSQEESFTITTYYPSPYGSYNELYVASKMGIGTTNPGAKLDVYGGVIRTRNSGTTGFTVFGSDSNWGYLTQNSYHDGSNWQRYDTNYQSWMITMGDNPTTDKLFIEHANAGANPISGFSQLLTITGGGKVGIGTADPQAKLDVDGQIKIRGGSPDAGKVLTTSDASGLGSWQEPNIPSGTWRGWCRTSYTIQGIGGWVCGDAIAPLFCPTSYSDSSELGCEAASGYMVKRVEYIINPSGWDKYYTGIKQ